MQNKINILIKIALTVFVAISAIGCINEKDALSGDLQSVAVGVRLSTAPMTKALDPTEAESVINEARIYAYLGSRQVGHFYSESVSSNQPVTIDLTLPYNGIYDVEFYVIANESSMSGLADLQTSMTRSDLSALQFNNILMQEGCPMYCIETVAINVNNVLEQPSNLPGHVGHEVLADKVTLTLSRPMAKIQIFAAKMDDASAVKINSVKILSKGTRWSNYLFPAEESVLQQMQPTDFDRTLLTDHTVSNVVSKDNLTDQSSYGKASEEEYIFEVPFGSPSIQTPVDASVNSVVLEVNYSYGDSPSKIGYVYMPAIERNNAYQVYCSFESSGNIILNYIVADWTDAQMWDGGLTFDYPSHSFLLPQPNGSASATPAVMVYGQGTDLKPFECYFQMTAPANQEWVPTVFDGIAADCVVEVWNSAGTEQLSAPFVSGNDWYRIKVIPKSSDNYGKEVKLAITYMPIWSVEAEYLVVNGNSTSPIWPYTGTTFTNDSDYIIITQQ